MPLGRTVQILYFAAIAELAGRREETVTLPNHVQTIAALARWLEETHPEFKGRLTTVRFAVDETFADPRTALSGGEVIAVIPPVSGG